MREKGGGANLFFSINVNVTLFFENSYFFVPFSVKTSDEGGFTEQLKKLQAEVDAKKLELARREAFRNRRLNHS